MRRGVEEARDAEAATLPRRPEPTPAPAPDYFLTLCRLFNFVTIFCALMCGATFGVAIAERVHGPNKDIMYMAGQVLRVYGICTVILVCLVELDWAILAAWWPLLESWLGRAALQSFLAVLAYREGLPRNNTEFLPTLALFRVAASAALLACAALYFLGWVTCLGTIKSIRERRSKHLRDARSEYESLEKRRAELQRLLVTDPAI